MKTFCTKFSVGLFAVFLTSCQTASEKAQVNLDKTLIRFQALENRIEKSCLVATSLAAPTKARYQESYAKEGKEVRSEENFLWEISGSRCEVKPVTPSSAAWEENHHKIIKAAFCTLLMGFQMESPLKGVPWMDLKKEWNEGVWSWMRPSPGIASARLRLEPVELEVTSTQNTVFTARYVTEGAFPKLKSLKRESAGSGLELEALHFQDFSQGKVVSVFPRELEEFDLFIRDGAIQEFQLYGHVKIQRCE